MTTRTDVTVDWEVSPRIITVASPSIEITMQDLVDTLRTLEDDLNNLDNTHLVAAAGKENLGGGVSVGITVTLQNAKLAFEARIGPSFTQCSISGGNLVAVDDVGADIDPVESTAFTQIIRTSSSSATISNQTALEHAVFDGYILLDEGNISGLAATGTTYPAGTSLQPCLNITDATSIAVTRGFNIIKVKGNATFTGTPSLDNYQLHGDNQSQTHVTFSSADTGDISIKNIHFEGSMSGALYTENCSVHDVTGVGCTTNISTFKDTTFLGNVTLRADNNQDIHLENTSSGIAGASTFIVNVNGSSGDLIIHHHKGGIKLTNITTTINITVDGPGTDLIIDSSCTATSSSIVVRGGTNITNNSSIVHIDQTVSALTWSQSTSSIVNGSFGEIVANLIKYSTNRSKIDKTAKTLTIYDDNGTTPIKVFDLKDDAGVASVESIYERIPQ